MALQIYNSLTRNKNSSTYGPLINNSKDKIAQKRIEKLEGKSFK